MPYKQTLEKGLKLFDEKYPNLFSKYTFKKPIVDLQSMLSGGNKTVYGYSYSDDYSDISSEVKSFLSTFAEEIREGMVGEVKEYTKEKGFFGDEDFKIVYVDDLLAQLKSK